MHQRCSKNAIGINRDIVHPFKQEICLSLPVNNSISAVSDVVRNYQVPGLVLGHHHHHCLAGTWLKHGCVGCSLGTEVQLLQHQDFSQINLLHSLSIYISIYICLLFSCHEWVSARCVSTLVLLYADNNVQLVEAVSRKSCL